MFDPNRNGEIRHDFGSMAMYRDPFVMNSNRPELIRGYSVVGEARAIVLLERLRSANRLASKIFTSLVSLKLKEFCSPDASDTSTDLELLLYADCSAKAEHVLHKID